VEKDFRGFPTTRHRVEQDRGSLGILGDGLLCVRDVRAERRKENHYKGVQYAMKIKKVVVIILALTLITGGGLFGIMTHPISVLAADTADLGMYDMPVKENVLPEKIWTIKFKVAIDPPLSSQALSNYIYVNDSSGNQVDLSVTPGNDSQSVLVKPPMNGYKSSNTYYLYIKKGLKLKGDQSLQQTVRMKFTIVSDVSGNLKIPTVGKTQIAAGWDTAYYLDSSGHVWDWGGYGEISSGFVITSSPKINSVCSTVPVQVSNLTDVVSIAAGNSSGYALDSSGNVWAWGSNYSGQLGNGTTNDSSTPVKVSNLSNIVAIAAKGVTNYALDSSEHVWTWGSNYYGQLGNGTSGGKDISTTPVQVSKLTDIVAIAAGPVTGYALDSSGHVWAWGDGIYGELGNGTSSDSKGPVQVPNLPKILAVDGGVNGYALDNYGYVWVWGENLDGSLGNGTTNNLSITSPVKVSNLSNIVAIAAGGDTQYALDGSGHVWSWGHNYGGQLGNNYVTNNSTVPVQVSNLKNIVSIAGGFVTGYALDSSGHIWAWGEGEYGQYGNGTSGTFSITPVQVSNIPPK